MKIYRLHNFMDYKKYAQKCRDENLSFQSEVAALIPETNMKFTTPGYSYLAQQKVEFQSDFLHSSGFPDVNWRERLICPITNLNSRVRAAFQIFETFSGCYYDDDIYIMEQTTDAYRYLKENYPNAVGSEYLGNEVPFGECNSRGWRNEDATNLTFEDNSLASILSFDVLEHIPDYKAVIKECVRTLVPGGTLFLTAPFDVNSPTNLERAKIDDNGEIEFLMTPEYHGDPVSKEGILCFWCYSWELLDDMRACGFESAQVLFFKSKELGYYTNQIVILATKPRD